MDFAVAKECGRPVDELRYVPLYRRRQAEVLVVARHRARVQIANKNKCSPRDVWFFGE